jgi:xanthine dehydrogenase YagR molybdenum-binding subunit
MASTSGGAMSGRTTPASTPACRSTEIASSIAVRRACEALRKKLQTAGGRIPAEGLEAEGEVAGAWDEPNYKNYSMGSYGAQFAEVGVDADTGEVRLRRMLGVFAPGRILNHKTARS